MGVPKTYIMNFFKIPTLVIVTLFLSLASCQQDEKDSSTINQTRAKNIKLFELKTSAQTGITFNNTITETEQINNLIYDAVHQGGGVAAADFNNDGMIDLFFTGNMSLDRLYINKGNLKFEDITNTANVNKGDNWSTGVAVADVNNDGWMDIYVCKFLLENVEQRKNHLYINNGDLTFTESAEKYGIADIGYGINANFFDYDKDGWLDLYIANQPPNHAAVKKQLKGKKDTKYTDRLYKNNGDGTFTDVTRAAGITNYSFTLSATVGDINNDGWLDIYVACDYEEPDMMFINNGDGTFTNKANEALKHMSNFSMGADLADINNDGWLDIYTADMVADDNRRLKTNMSGMNPKKFWGLANAGYHYQYMFNALQLNNGNGTFSEIAQIAGVSQTDWSWSPLFADFDNDGYKDLIVTNGNMRDTRHNDMRTRVAAYQAQKRKEAEAQGVAYKPNLMEIVEMAPQEKLSNYIYKNNGDLTFTRKTKDWGLDTKSWSNGAAYADLDNDGDLDLIINNINDPVFLYENKASNIKLNNYLRVKLIGNGNNRHAIGSRVIITYDETQQMMELSPVRGFISTSECMIHFGVGDKKSIDKLEVRWPDGSFTVLKNVKTNQVIDIQKKNTVNVSIAAPQPKPLFKDVTESSGINFVHQENDFDDYRREILLPHKMSTLGPCLAVADVNNDKLDDFFIGGPSGQAGILYLQQRGGSFTMANTSPWSADIKSEDVGALFFDADGDGDQDLYIVSGGNDFVEGSNYLQDRLYLNDGKGHFSKANNALPKMISSGSKATAGDFDNDGDLDLFVGGRQIPGKYGYAGRSYLLKNDKGKFTDVTDEVAPAIAEIGMVTDGVWIDYDKDGDTDLVVLGEWMPISFFENNNGKLNNVTEEKGFENSTGWWNCITATDIDNDGDIDFIAGNLGLNIKYKASENQPFKAYIKDFDGDNTNDVYLGYYDKDGVCYPVRGRQCSSQQLNFITTDFPNYESFAAASIDEVLGDRRDGALLHEAKIFESVIIINNGEGGFEIQPLPNEAQISPIFGALVYDWNNDQINDLFVAGNYYNREVETTRSDAGIGCVLIGNKETSFRALHPVVTGIYAANDVRAVELIMDDQGRPLILIANNNGPMQVYRLNRGELN